MTTRLIASLTALAALSSPAAAQMLPSGDWMPRRGTVSYDMTLTRAWSPMSMRMLGRITVHDAGTVQRHCMQVSYAPVMTCQTSINGEPGNLHTVPAPPPSGARVGPNRFLAPPGAAPPYPRPYAGGPSVPGFVPPPFSFPGGPPGPDFEISGEWEWQGWRVYGRFRYSGAYW